MKNYYNALGVHNNATIQEIKSAFRKLAIRLHPDKNSGDKFFEERFRDLKEAYETLSDNVRKTDYDIKLGYYSSSSDHDHIRKYKELLKRKYKDELKRREEDIRKKYRSLDQSLKEEHEKRKKLDEARKTSDELKQKAEKHRMLNEIEGFKRLLLQKDQRLASAKQKLLAAESEIIKARKDVSVLTSKINKYKAAESGKGSQVTLHENPEILKELIKIKGLVPLKDTVTFMRMVMQYAETSSLPSKYGRDYPHLLMLILKNTVRIKPFKMFCAKYKNDAKTMREFKSQMLTYLNCFPI